MIVFTGFAAKTAPTPKLAILDFTGSRLRRPAARRGRDRRSHAERCRRPSSARRNAAFDTAAIRIRPYLVGDAATPAGDQTRCGRHRAWGARPRPALDLWTRNINEPGLQATLTAALGDAVRKGRLVAAGLAPATIAALDAAQPKVTQFSPRSSQGEVSLKDRLPGIAGFAMGVVLWSLILTGAQASSSTASSRRSRTASSRCC